MKFQGTREEFIKLWVEKLRSGEYKQTKEVLRDKNGFCCLGVACDLYDSDKWQNRGGFLFGYEDEGMHDTTLPLDIQTFINCTSEGDLNFIDRNPSLMCLASLNDTGFTFSQIADIIEAGLLKEIE